MKSTRLFVSLAIAAFVAVAHGQSLGVAGNFNDFILGNATQSNVDAEGLYAVGGNANFSNFTINTSHDALYSGYGMIAGGTYTNSFATVNGGIFSNGTFSAIDPSVNGSIHSNGAVNLSSFGTVNGSITYGTSYTNPNTTVSGSATHVTTAAPIDFAATGTFLKNLSASLATHAANGNTNLAFSTLKLTGSDSILDIFSVTAAQLASSTDFQIFAPGGATVLVNISGTSASMHGGLALNGVTADHVLYNFSDATSLTMSGIGVLGTILAPNGALSFSSGNVDGEIIAGSLTGGVESHDILFKGNLPSSTPEPFTLGMSAVLAGAWLRRRMKSA